MRRVRRERRVAAAAAVRARTGAHQQPRCHGRIAKRRGFVVSVIVRFRLECTVMMRMVRMMRMVVLGACVRGWLLGVLSCVVVMVMVMVVR